MKNVTKLIGYGPHGRLDVLPSGASFAVGARGGGGNCLPQGSFFFHRVMEGTTHLPEKCDEHIQQNDVHNGLQSFNDCYLLHNIVAN